ncbi:GHKL domain-containing protein [Schaedlerella sp.]|uniref:GHKL domain-containing protein n=1 Tax=Schaedlerella sp. TaxID=2676057 RepID=UPI00374648EB
MLILYEYIERFFVHYGYTVEMLFAVSIFAFHLERRNWFILRAAGSYCLVLAGYAVFYRSLAWQSIGLTLLFYFFIDLLICLSLGLCFHASGWTRLFVLTGADITQHIAFRIYTVVLSFSGLGYEGIGSGILNGCIIAAVYLMVFGIFRKQLKDIREYVYNGRANIVLGVLVFAVAFLIFQFENQYDFMRTNPEINLLFSAYAVLANAFLLALLYSIFQSRKMTGEMEMLEDVIDRQKFQYQLMKENIDNVNIKCHDMKQQISMFENRIDQDALHEIKSIIHVYDMTFKTGNEVLDVFLQEKLLRCEREQIKMDCIVDGKSVDFIRPADLYTLVGNAIDNAVDAVRKIENPEKRIISLSVRESMNMVLMHVDNEFAGSIEMRGGLPRSTKGDDLNHGFGMRSMYLIAEKYKGTLSVGIEGNIFNLNILIPVPERKPPE